MSNPGSLAAKQVVAVAERVLRSYLYRQVPPSRSGHPPPTWFASVRAAVIQDCLPLVSAGVVADLVTLELMVDVICEITTFDIGYQKYRLTGEFVS